MSEDLARASFQASEALFQAQDFQAHVELLRLFLDSRDRIVERLQEVLNAQRKPARYLQDRSALFRHVEDCFFSLAGITEDQSRLRGRLRAAHRASGFIPAEVPGMHNDVADPAELAMRGFSVWRQTRWPGRNGRVRYAQTLFDLYALWCLQLLSMRLWDAGAGEARDRLSQVQVLLDRLWETAPADQPVLVRDARWLIPLAQSPANEELAPYFEVAQRIEKALPEEDRIEICRADALLAGGHLRSQLRHYVLSRGESLGGDSLVLRTRRSNALDFGIVVQSLALLLKAYERARNAGDHRGSLELADAICQGLSADPELFVNRLDLLAAYSMIEHLFVTVEPGAQDHGVAYSPAGRRHVQLLREYAALIGRLSKPLHEDCLRFRPAAAGYSPYGVIYGFAYNLLEHMALKTLWSDAAPRFGLEDVFTHGGDDKLVWVDGWRNLPHVGPEVRKLYEYPRQFAQDVFDRVERALRRRVFESEGGDTFQTGRLYVLSGGDAVAGAEAGAAGAGVEALSCEEGSRMARAGHLSAECLVSSDEGLVTAGKARFCDPARLLRDRREGMFCVSYRTPGGWTALTKDFLTGILGAGRDAKVAGLPDEATQVLRLTCPGLILNTL